MGGRGRKGWNAVRYYLVPPSVRTVEQGSEPQGWNLEASGPRAIGVEISEAN